MVFIESPIFTRLMQELLTDDSYARLQQFLEANPDAGDVIQGTGGLRKIRWSTEGRGKRGGMRVIYFHISAACQIRMLLVYKKGRQDNLTPEQKRRLLNIQQEWDR